MDKDFWQELFVERVDLNPPGYDDVIAGFTNNPYVTPKERKAARSKKKAHFTSIKHGVDS